MNVNINLTNIGKVFRGILKYHYLIFVTLMVIGVSFTVYSINSILSMPSDESFRQQEQKNTISNKFDEATINKIDKLKFSSEPGQFTLPPGRTNPFTE